MTKAVDDLQDAIEKHNERSMSMRAARDRLVAIHSRPLDFCYECGMTAPCDVRRMLDVIQAYEDGMTWMTTCTHCASLWNDNYNQYERIEALLRQMDRLGIKADSC